tara:strand:+ start:3093 stop:3854 length:762 start_codon:yes stop_codon:yes gene_type:complete
MTIIEAKDRFKKATSMIKISRTSVEQNIKCPRCFVLDKKHRIKPFSLPFTLNIAVDELCKNEFDYYRAKAEPHPLFIEHGIDAVPFAHEQLDDWRNWRKGIRTIDEENGINFGGAIDDVWQKSTGELIVADVKATAKKVFDWEKTCAEYDYPKSYQRQLEMYQYLLKKNGFEVAPEAYLVYYNGRKNEPMFNQEIKFDLHLIKVDCDFSWVDQAILDTKKSLEGPMPKSTPTCENCNYLKARWNLSQQNVEDA